MFELIVIACLVAEPEKCERFSLPFQESMGMMRCMREGQFQIVTWEDEHPEWHVRRWICEMPKV
jgi:hypothetical protein